jgi:hypothetical protein
MLVHPFLFYHKMENKHYRVWKGNAKDDNEVYYGTLPTAVFISKRAAVDYAIYLGESTGVPAKVDRIRSKRITDYMFLWTKEFNVEEDIQVTLPLPEEDW